MINRQPTQANNLGPFYRAGSPRCANGDSLLRSATDGTPLVTTDAAGAFSCRSVKPGFKTIASQVYDPDDPHLETDSQFGVTKALVGSYERTASGYSMQFTFVLEPGESSRPTPPITGKQGQTTVSGA